MKISELRKEHDDLIARKDDYLLYSKAYIGSREFVRYALKQHPLEPDSVFADRKETGYAVTYTCTLIDTLCNYLAYKPVSREVGSLTNDELFQMYLNDANLLGDSHDAVMSEAGKIAKIFGFCGVLVDSPDTSDINSRQSSIDSGIYPYVSLFSPLNVLDWEYDYRSIRPRLTYLVLRDDSSRYFVFTTEKSSVYFVPDDKTGEDDAELLSEKENKFGEIFFYRLINRSNPLEKDVGISDAKDIAPIDASIIQNLSILEQVLKYNGFPILAVPNNELLDSDKDGKLSLGPSSVMLFDPENPNSKPSWVPTEALNASTAVLNTIRFKVEEGHRMLKLQSQYSVGQSAQARTGTSFRRELEQLVADLNQALTNSIRVEEKILYAWCKLAGYTSISKNEIIVSRSREFGLDDISQNLSQLQTSLKLVASETYRSLVENSVVSRTFPDIDDKTRRKILDEAAEGRASLVKETSDETDLPSAEQIANQQAQLSGK